jgi:polygalacturonase/pectin methylesterase-like acyl-CoA thioesterase
MIRILRYCRRILLVTALMFAASGGTAIAAQHRYKSLVVSPNNPHDYMTIQAAISAIPSGGKSPVIILVRPGIYHERLVIPADKPPITLVGQNPANTMIEYSLIAYDKGPNGRALGMWRTATVWVRQNNFAAENISFVNDGGQGGPGYTRLNGQALAMRIDSNHCVFYHCRFSSWQDTLLLNSGKNYFQNCRITGTTDFIFGPGTGYFSRCLIHCLGAGFMTAAKTPASHPFGLVFNHCRVVSSTGPDQVVLGRPWGEHASVMFLNSFLPNAVKPCGWISWHHNPVDHRTTRFSEFGCFGPGADPAHRITWERPLSATQARRISAESALSGRHKKWFPQKVLLQRLIEPSLIFNQPRFPHRTVNITAAGAIEGGKQLCTAAIQKAINECRAQGGGEVVIPRGVFLTGPIVLRSNINLHLQRGAELLMTDQFSKFPLSHHRYQNCITALHCDDIAITGRGTINGNGAKWWALYKKSKPGGAPSLAADKLPHRPYLIFLGECRHVVVRGVHLKNSPMCNLVLGGCRDVLVQNLDVTAPQHSPNTDGMDPEGHNMLIMNCTFDEGDDCIAIKAGGRTRLLHPTSENFVITHCHFFHGHGLSVGSGTSGGLVNVLATHCTFDGTQAGVRLKASEGHGGLVENLFYRHLRMKNVDIPILISSYYNDTSPWVYQVPQRALHDTNPEPMNAYTPRWRHIDISDLHATGAATAGFIVGRPESPARIALNDIRIVAAHGLQIVNSHVAMRRVKLLIAKGPKFRAVNSHVSNPP